MKTRTGFVSNSSSSSFCIIGTSNWSRVLAKKEGLYKTEHYEEKVCEHGRPNKKTKYCPQCGFEFSNAEDFTYPELAYGSAQGKVFSYYGSEDVDYAGLDAEELLKKMTIPQACKHVQEIAEKKLGVKIPSKQLGFFYGEAGNG